MSSTTILVASDTSRRIASIVGAFASVKSHLTTALCVADIRFRDTDAEGTCLAQPVGWDEICYEATTRCDNAISYCEDVPRACVVVENGIINICGGSNTNLWLDVAWVLLRDTKTGLEFNASSAGIPVPWQAVDEAGKRSFDTTSVGDILHEQDADVEDDDFCTTLCAGATSRDKLIQGAVVACVGQWIKSLGMKV